MWIPDLIDLLRCLDEFRKCRPQLGLEKNPRFLGKAIKLASGLWIKQNSMGWILPKVKCVYFGIRKPDGLVNTKFQCGKHRLGGFEVLQE
jgi:hypothetical protein